MKSRCILRFLFGILILLRLTGCSNYTEINNVMIVDGIGIDKINDKYLVSFNTYKGDNKYEIYNVLVDDLDTSFNEIYLLVNKKIYLSHLNILLINSSLSNDDMLEIFNTFNNRGDLRGSFLVAMVNNYNTDIFTNENIPELLENNYKEAGNIYPTTFNEIISNYLDYEISYIPVINNNDLSIAGTHSIFDEYHFYNQEESSYLNLVFDKLNTYSFDINNSPVQLINIDTYYLVNDNNISINIDSIYISDLRENEIKSYLVNKINYFLEKDISTNYFINIIKKYNYDYYSKNNNFEIDFDINISLNKEEFNNTREDDLFEKNS